MNGSSAVITKDTIKSEEMAGPTGMELRKRKHPVEKESKNEEKNEFTHGPQDKKKVKQEPIENVNGLRTRKEPIVHLVKEEPSEVVDSLNPNIGLFEKLRENDKQVSSTINDCIDSNQRNNNVTEQKNEEVAKLEVWKSEMKDDFMDSLEKKDSDSTGVLKSILTVLKENKSLKRELAMSKKENKSMKNELKMLKRKFQQCQGILNENEEGSMDDNNNSMEFENEVSDDDIENTSIKKTAEKSDNVVSAVTTARPILPFACEHCGRKFAMKNQLQRHSKIHTGERDFACEQCEAKFTQSSGLFRHIREVHTRERKFHCEQCYSKFTSAGVLRVHIRHVHSGKKPFSCEICQKAFASNGQLKAHAVTHQTPPKKSLAN